MEVIMIKENDKCLSSFQLKSIRVTICYDKLIEIMCCVTSAWFKKTWWATGTAELE